MTQANHLLRALGIICDVNDYHAVLEWRNTVTSLILQCTKTQNLNSTSILHQVIDICDQNTKNVNVTCLIHDVNFLYETLVELHVYELKIL